MATIDETIKNYIEMLSCEVDSSDEKGDSQQETQSLLDFHLWCLLQNKGLIEIVKEYLALSDEGKLDFAYEKVFTCGVRLIDFQYVIYGLFGEGERDFNEFLLLQTDFSLVHPIVKEDKKEESSIRSPRIEQKPHEAYLSLVLRSCQEVGGEEKSFIELRSNLLFVKAFLQEIFERTKSINYIEEEGRFRIIDVSGVFDDCEIFKSEAARLNFAESEEENSIVIEGAEEQIESVYYGIRLFLPFVMVEVKKHNLFFKLKCRISELKNRFLGIKLQRLPLSEEVSNMLDDHGCQYIQDLLVLPMDKTSLNALEEILKCIEEMDQSTPGELLHVLMRRLKPSHELVIRMRFCGENISTLEDVGSYFGVTRERVRQIEAKSIRFFNAPERRAVRSRIIAQMQLLCKFDNFIAPIDFQTLELSKGELLFLEKCLEDISYSYDFKVFFYSKASEGILMRALEDLPTYFTVNDLEFYVEYLFTETDNRFSPDEIEYLLKVKYKRYGDYFSILSIIPPDMFNFYFFDGESIADFFLGSDGGRNFRNAFLKLYGLDTLSLMVENFARSLKRAGSSSNAYENYQEILAKTKEQIAALERCEDHKKDLINQLDVLQVKLQALKEDYEKSGGVSLEDWKRLNSELVREETQREEYNRWLKDFANHYLPFIIVEKQLNILLRQIESEKEVKKKVLMAEILSSEPLKEKLSAFLSASKIDGAYAEQILAFVRDAAVQSVDAKAIFDFSDAQLTRIVTQIYEKLEFDKVLAKKVLKSIKSSLSTSKKIRNIIMGSNVDRYEEYAKQKEELGNSIKELTIRIEQLNQEISLQEIQVDQCQKELKKAKEAYEKLLKSRSIGNMAERAVGVYSRLEERLIERQGKILQDEFLNCFSSIINKDNFIDGIIIDKNINVIPYKFVDVSFLQIDNYLKNDEKSHFLELFDVKYLMDINDLRLGKVDSIKLPAKITAPFSQGERQVYIMALYLALLKTSRKDIPFFIDTPFARIDSNHRDRIVKKFFRGIENQIFILSTDEEIVGQYELLIDDAVANKFLLKINAYGYTQVLANQYFEVAE